MIGRERQQQIGGWRRFACWMFGHSWRFSGRYGVNPALARGGTPADDVLYSWQQTADESERENAAWRGWARDVERLLHAIDRDLMVAEAGKVYYQHVYAARLAERLRAIKSLSPGGGTPATKEKG